MREIYDLSWGSIDGYADYYNRIHPRFTAFYEKPKKKGRLIRRPFFVFREFSLYQLKATVAFTVCQSQLLPTLPAAVLLLQPTAVCTADGVLDDSHQFH